MITIYKIFEIYGLDPSKIKLVRHSNARLNILDAFRNDLPRLETYQSFQQPKKFGNTTSIAVFAPYHKTTALFLGLWDILDYIKNSDFTEGIARELQEHNFPQEWLQNSIRYQLKKNSILDDLSERLVIEWGKGTVAWVQAQDKEVVEIKGKHSIGDFQSFDTLELSFSELQKLTQFPDQNLTWVKALSSVNGVYLIRDEISGKLYVGSAYGEKGIYGRWSTYARTGHGNNKELLALDSVYFRFSILEIVPSTATPETVIDCENKWKNKLGTRYFGLNKAELKHS